VSGGREWRLFLGSAQRGALCITKSIDWSVDAAKCIHHIGDCDSLAITRSCDGHDVIQNLISSCKSRALHYGRPQHRTYSLKMLPESQPDLLVDVGRDTLDAATSSKPPDVIPGYTLEIVLEDTP